MYPSEISQRPKRPSSCFVLSKAEGFTNAFRQKFAFQTSSSLHARAFWTLTFAFVNRSARHDGLASKGHGGHYPMNGDGSRSGWRHGQGQANQSDIKTPSGLVGHLCAAGSWSIRFRAHTNLGCSLVSLEANSHKRGSSPKVRLMAQALIPHA